MACARGSLSSAARLSVILCSTTSNSPCHAVVERCNDERPRNSCCCCGSDCIPVTPAVARDRRAGCRHLAWIKASNVSNIKRDQSPCACDLGSASLHHRHRRNKFTAPGSMLLQRREVDVLLLLGRDGAGDPHRARRHGWKMALFCGPPITCSRCSSPCAASPRRRRFSSRIPVSELMLD